MALLYVLDTTDVAADDADQWEGRLELAVLGRYQQIFVKFSWSIPLVIKFGSDPDTGFFQMDFITSQDLEKLKKIGKTNVIHFKIH